MASIYFQALWQILRLEYYICRGDFAPLCERVRSYPLSSKTHRLKPAEEICNAVDLVCIWYPKRVVCLQRSAATVCLLKRFGVPAHMVIGVQHMPFIAHAWVEVNGAALNERTNVQATYGVCERC